jgi:transposase InsO family protein
MADNAKFTFLLVVVDIFSKFIFIRPLLTKSSVEVAYALQCIFFENGPPLIMQSDNGLEFTSKPMPELCEKFKIEYRHGRVYKPTSQGCVERINRTIKGAINADLIDLDSWRYVDLLQHYTFCYNNTKHQTTGYTP